MFLSHWIPVDHLSIGPLRIYYYSLCLLAAVWIGYVVAVRKGKVYNFSNNFVTDLVAEMLIAGVLGGRIGFVVQNIPYFSQNPSEILRLTSGGLSIHGAIVAGLLTLWWTNRRRKVALVKLTDTLALPLLAGQTIGRLGNYFNQELYGYPTEVPWKIIIDPAHRLPGYFASSYFHPTFLYEIILNLIGFALLWFWQPKKPGQLTLGFLAVFAINRFIVEIWRISDRPLWSLSSAQIISLIILAGLGIIVAKQRETRPSK